MADSVENVVVCRLTRDQSPSVYPCAVFAAQGYAPQVISVLLLDPATNLQNTQTAVDFDYANAGAAFAFGLTLVLTFWLIAKPIGMMLGLIKSS